MSLAGGQFGPIRRLGGTDDHRNRQAAYDFVFRFNTNHGSISLGFQAIDDMFFGLKDILATYGSHGHDDDFRAWDFLLVLYSSL